MMDRLKVGVFRAAVIWTILVSSAALAAPPVSPNASSEAKVVLDYLYEQFGKKTLSGQMYAPWGIDEIETVKNITGKYPAIRGEDLITESAGNLVMADLKRIADHLTVLRDANVPVLWRPMHESDGGWF